MKIFFSVGEPSGDLHAANLIRELRRERPGTGSGRLWRPADGGSRLRFARRSDGVGRDVVFASAPRICTSFSTWRVAPTATFATQRPDAVVLIDYPGFNWWIARRAKAHGIPVFYYVPPQIWAWASWRVKKMRRLVDHVLCSLPFEVELVRRAGLPRHVRRPSLL